MTLHFRQYHHYSPLLGGMAVRVSACDARGGEFFMILPREPRKTWRLRRTEALELIGAAIDARLDPGEVVAA